MDRRSFLTTLAGTIAASAANPYGLASASNTMFPGLPPAGSNIGFFRFDASDQLERSYFRDAPVRVAITWGEFEPEPGRFVFDGSNRQFAAIDNLLRDGFGVIPSIRSKSRWAVKALEGPTRKLKKKKASRKSLKRRAAASAPRDMNLKKPLREGESYSDTYYRFIRTIAERYRGRFPVVVIENEINDPFPDGGDWGSSVDEYIRLLLTAKKAFRDVDASVLIADGGLQPRPLFWLTIDDYIARGKVSEAIQLYKRMEGRSLSQRELLNEMTEAFADARVPRAKEFIEADLHRWVDIANFHYNHSFDALPEIMTFLRRHAPPGKLFMCNGYGAAAKYVDDEDTAKEIIKRSVRLLALQVSPIVLNTLPGNGRVSTALVDRQGHPRPLHMKAFEAAARFLGEVNPTSVKDNSCAELWSFRFRSPNGLVDVVWPKNNRAAGSIRIADGRAVYNYCNEKLGRVDRVPAQHGPYFLVAS